jgi:hypothetical protein
VPGAFAPGTRAAIVLAVPALKGSRRKTRLPNAPGANAFNSFDSLGKRPVAATRQFRVEGKSGKKTVARADRKAARGIRGRRQSLPQEPAPGAPALVYCFR